MNDDVMKIRILIADDHLMVRKGLSVLIQGEPDFDLAGEAENGSEAVSAYRELRPDVVLMDIVMPEVNGIEAIRIIRAEYPSANIIALTSFPDAHLIRGALKAGASGFLYKDVGADELLAAIRQVNEGQAAINSDVLSILMSQPEPRQKDEARGSQLQARLSPREKDVLRLLVLGMSTKQIALELYIQPSTVKQALSGLYQKMRVNNRTEAVAVALKEKMIVE